MEERVFFDEGHVRVTNARFIVGNQTYAMSGVTSVASSVAPPSRAGLIIGVVIGLIILVAADGVGKIVGLLIAGACAYGLFQQKATHAVVLRSASGEVQALSSKDADHITGVVAALNDALVHRG